MSSTATIHERAAQRCAFCKIDLRGRFVFANSEAEELLGATQVEIFGHPVVEFLDSENHQTIKEIISHSSHFETAYDAAPVTIVRRDGSRFATTVVLSLNFRSGTPVNYDIIITPPTPVAPDAAPTDDVDVASTLDTLLEADPSHPTTELAAALCKMTGARNARFFEVSPQSGVILAEASHSNDPDESSEADLLTLEYPLLAKPPISVQLQLRSGSPEQDEQIQRSAERVVGLLSRSIAPVIMVSAADVSEVANAPSIDLFERLGLGLIEFDSEGRVISANQSARQLLAGSGALGSVDDLMATLASKNDTALIERLRIGSHSTGEGESRSIVTETVLLSDGKNYLVHLSSAQAKRNGCLVMVGQSLPADREQMRPLLNYLAESLAALEASVRAMDGFCQNLEHENRGELHGHGGFYLNSLRRQWSRVDESLHELQASLELARKDSELEITDPGLILSRAFEEASARRAEDAVELRLTEIPKIHTDRTRLTVVMRSLMIHLVSAAESSVQVQSHMTDGQLALRFLIDVSSSRRAQLERAWSGTAVGAADLPSLAGGRVVTLGGLKSLAALSGGGLQLKSTDQSSLVFELTVPLQAISHQG